jgi:hypothetical protein
MFNDVLDDRVMKRNIESIDPPFLGVFWKKKLFPPAERTGSPREGMANHSI